MLHFRGKTVDITEVAPGGFSREPQRRHLPNCTVSVSQDTTYILSALPRSEELNILLRSAGDVNILSS